jgi:hypothetical protein
MLYSLQLLSEPGSTRLVGCNFSHVEIKVRSCRQQASSNGHLRRVDKRATLSNHAIGGFRSTSSAKTTATTPFYACLTSQDHPRDISHLPIARAASKGVSREDDVSSRACQERFVEDNSLPIKIKVRSCSQQALSNGLTHDVLTRG